MPLPKPTLTVINQQLNQHQDSLDSLTPVGGGCICQSFKLTSKRGKVYFLKTLENAPAKLFSCEANGLLAIKNTHTAFTPTIIAADTDCLLLEYLPPADGSEHMWRQLGQQLAQMHQQTEKQFGFAENNYCGQTVQNNRCYDDGFDFFNACRLGHQLNLAKRKSLLTTEDLRKFQQIQAKLPELLPAEPPCLLHGDLWSGNVLFSTTDRPYLIDPACYWGWRETDIAMTRLFGGFPEHFYQAYHHHYPLQNDWQQRLDIYNLYPLLNHLNLFGNSYLPQLREILNRFC